VSQGFLLAVCIAAPVALAASAQAQWFGSVLLVLGVDLPPALAPE